MTQELQRCGLTFAHTVDSSVVQKTSKRINTGLPVGLAPNVYHQPSAETNSPAGRIRAIMRKTYKTALRRHLARLGRKGAAVTNSRPEHTEQARKASRAPCAPGKRRGCPPPSPKRLELAIQAAREGRSMREISAIAGICRFTLIKWRKKYPELGELLPIGANRPIVLTTEDVVSSPVLQSQAFGPQAS